jgi:Domain of unknown function (DUF927)
MPSTLTTGDFLRDILPTTGVYFAARYNPKTDGRGFFHEPHTDIAQLVLELKGFDNNRKDAFFACASYQQARYYDEVRDKWRTRTQDNVLAVRSLWTDIDVDPSDPTHYPDLPSALTALTAFCKSAGIPQPTHHVVSGYGVHCYWALDTDLEPAAWRPLASRLQALQHHFGLKVDHRCTLDSARVLRPVGTHNYKRGSQSPVRGVRRCGPLSPEVLLAQLTAACDSLGVTFNKTTVRSRGAPLTGDLAAYASGTEYPPCDANRIADQCAVFGAMRDTHGAEQSEPLWANCLIVLAHTEGGEAIAHAWSQGHEEYDEVATDAKLAYQKDAGYKPVLCSTFRTSSGGLCAGCPHTINSPISLGMGETVHQTEVTDPESGTVEVVPPMPALLEGKFKWTAGKGLQYLLDPNKAKGPVAEDAIPSMTDGATQPFWVPVSRQYPVLDFIWWDNVSDEYYVRTRARIASGDWATNDLRMSTVGRGGPTLMGDLSGKLQVICKGYNAHTHMEIYMKTWIEHVQTVTNTRTVRSHLGWQPDGGFLLGKTLYLPSGEQQDVAVSRNILNYVGAHIPRGNYQDFAAAINHLYNRPHFEAYQFAFLASFASVLLPLTWSGPVGIPVSLWSTETGRGKSAVAKAGIAVWGDPNANGQVVDAEGATEHALYVIAGQRRNMPVLLDETTKWTGDKLSAFAYRYSTGVPKAQGRAEGGLRDNSHISWANIIYLTANNSISGQITSALKNAGAQVARVIEIEIPDRDLHTDDKGLFDVLVANSGAPGDRFLRWLTPQHRLDAVAANQRALEQSLYKRCKVGTEARYWVAGVAAVLMAAKITKALKLHDFDTQRLERWSHQLILSLSGTVRECYEDPEDTLSDMIREFYPGLIITETEYRRQGVPFAPGCYPPRGAVTGRVILDTHQLYLPVTQVRQWCAKAGVDYSQLVVALSRRSILWDEDDRFNLGRGTSIPAPRTRVWRIESEQIIGLVADVIRVGEDNDKVIRGRFPTAATPNPEAKALTEIYNA